jgi:hypothetical protein
MTKLIEAFRRNPDAIALAVVAVLLGIGRQAVVARPSAFCNPTQGVHWVSLQAIEDAVDNLRTELRDLTANVPAGLRLPDFRR